MPIDGSDEARPLTAESAEAAGQWAERSWKAAISSNRLRIAQSPRNGAEPRKRLSDDQVGFTQAGDMTMNAPAGGNDDMVPALAMEWFGGMHCSGPLGPPREVRW